MVFIDRARAAAIFLALFAHAFGYIKSVGLTGHALERWLYLITSSATPMFIILFGMMIEIVYVRRVARDGIVAISWRLVVRSFQCYLGYLVITLGAVVGGAKDWAGMWDVVTFAGSFQLGSILRFYVVGLIAAIPIILSRRRFGWGVIPFLGLLPWIVDPYLPSLSFPAAHFAAYGLGMGSVGPSVFHGFTFIAVGMALGKALIEPDGQPRIGRFGVALGSVAAAACVVSATLFVVEGMSVSDFVGGYIIGFRGDNHPAYFAIGTVLTCGWLAVFTLTRGIVWESPLRVFGVSSLIAYSLGNMVIAAYPTIIGYESEAFWTIVGGAIILTLAIVPLIHLVRAATRWYDLTIMPLAGRYGADVSKR